MNLKRAIWMGALVYIISFILGFIGALIIGIDLTTVKEPTTGLWIFGIIVTVIVMIIFTIWYFKGKELKASAKEGFLFGITTVILGFILDLLISFILRRVQDLSSYYSNPLFWVTLFILLITSTVVGWARGLDLFFVESRRGL
jgi:hypothetical protein